MFTQKPQRYVSVETNTFYLRLWFFLLQAEHECDIKKNREVTSTNVATVELSVAVMIHYYKLYPVSYREVEFQFKKDKKKKLELMLL